MAPTATANPNERDREAPDVFVSYSRTDEAVARRICEALTRQGRNIWVDWGSIHPSAEWLAEIERGIRSTNAFVFVISPDSVVSEICQRELDLAVQLGKRVVPIVGRDTTAEKVLQELRKRHWIFLRKQDSFDEGIEALTRALDVDIDWLHRHTAQLAQALAWSDAGRDRSRLLKGSALQQAEAWLLEGTHREPSPAEVQVEFIQASRRAATSRLRRILAGAVTGMIVAAVLTAWALYASYAAKVARDEAVARRLGAESSLVSTERDSLIERSALLAIESWRRKPSLENDVPLRRALPLLPMPVAGWGSWKDPVTDATFVGTEGTVAYATGKDVLIEQASGSSRSKRLPHASAVLQLAACAGGPTLASRTVQGKVFIWNVETLEILGVAPDVGAATSIRCSADGKILAVGRADGIVSAYRASDGGHLADLEGKLTGNIVSLAFSDDSHQVAAGSSEGLQVWNTESAEVVAFMKHRRPVVDIAFDPNGGRIATASDSGVYVWSLQNGAPIKRIGHPTNVDAVAFDRSGKRLVSGCGDQHAYVWNTTTFERIGRLRHQGPVTAVKFSADGSTILTASNDETARLWNARNGREMLRFAHDRVVAIPGKQIFVVAADFADSGKDILTAGRDGRVRVWRSELGNDRVYLARSSGRVWSRDGRFVAEKRGPGSWEVRETLPGRRVIELESLRGILAFAVGPGEREIAVSTFSGDVKVISTTDSSLRQELKLPMPADAVAFSPDGTRLVTGSRDRIVRYWSVPDAKMLWEKSHGGLVMSSAVSANGELVATGGTNSVARIWRASDGAIVKDLAHPHDVKDLAFSPDSRMLATACGDGTARVWDIESATIVRRMEHQFPIESITYDPSGSLVATASTDKTARIWRAASGVELSRIETAEAVERVGFVDASRLLVATDREVSLHPVHGKQLVDAACERLTRNLTLIEWAQYVGLEKPRATCPSLPAPVL